MSRMCDFCNMIFDEQSGAVFICPERNIQVEEPCIEYGKPEQLKLNFEEKGKDGTHF